MFGTKNMNSKDRLSLYVCTKVTGTAKAVLAKIEKPAKP